MSLITVVLMLLVACSSSLSAGSQNYISPLTLSSEAQATGSDVTIFVNATFRDPYVQITWYIGKTPLGYAVIENSTLHIYYKKSQYLSRINISVQGNSRTIQSQMIITNLQKSGSLEIGVFHGGSGTVMRTTLNVTNCPKSLGSNLVVLSSNRTYNQPGTFRCTNNGDLVYFNHSRRESNSTVCSQDATWNGQENLECWNAPNVDLKLSNMTGEEGDVVNVSCLELSNAYPPIDSYKLFIDGKMINNKANTSVSLIHEWNRKDAYCQVETNFTLLSNEKPANSSSKTITVYYKPVAVSQSELVCEWSKIQQDARCDVLFYSNPSSVVTSLYKDEVNLTGSHYYVLNTDVRDRYIFSLRRRTVLKEDFGQYIVTVSNSLYKGTFKFSVVLSTSSQINVGVIVKSVFGGLAAVALIAVSVYVVRRHQAKRTKVDNQATPNIQPDTTKYVNHNKVIGPNQSEGGEHPYIDLNI